MWTVFFWKKLRFSSRSRFFWSPKNAKFGKNNPTFSFPPSPSFSPPSHHFLRKSGDVGQFLGGARKCNFVSFLAQNHMDNSHFKRIQMIKISTRITSISRSPRKAIVISDTSSSSSSSSSSS